MINAEETSLDRYNYKVGGLIYLVLIVYFFVYLVGIIALSVVGNGLYSFITIRKPIKLSTLETFAISLCLGIIFIILYGYIVDLLINSLGLIQNTQFLILVILPIGFGIILKLFCMKKKIGNNSPLMSELKRLFSNAWQKVRDLVTSSKAKFGNGKDRRNNIIKLLIVFFIFFTLLFRIQDTIASSAAQFSQDPFIWMNVIINYANGLKIDYTVVASNPAGTFIFDAYFLQFLLFLPYSSQYFFLKWLPFLNVLLFFFILYVIQKRLFKNSIYFIVLFLLSLNKYFFYRFTMLLPSPLVVIILEFVVLLSLIPEIPRFLVYLNLGTTLAIHPISGLLVCGFYFAYKVLVGIIQLYRNFKTRHEPEEKRFRINIRKLAKDSLRNFIAFLIPVGFFILSLTLRFSPNWLFNYLWYLQSGVSTSNLDLSGSVIANAYGFLEPVSANLVTDWSAIVGNIGWILAWGNHFLIFTLISIFIPQKWYVDSKEKEGLVLFLRLSLLLGFLVFILPSLGFLLNIIGIIPGGSTVVNIIKSPFYYMISERLWEVINVLNVLLLGLIIEKIIRKIALHSRNSPQNYSREIRYTKIFVLGLFIGNLIFYVPYYEYNYNSRTVDGMLWFRDYLDRQTPGEKVIGYNREDSDLPTLVNCILPLGNNYTQIWYDLTTVGIDLNFTNNLYNNFDFLVISFHSMNSTIAGEIREAYFDSSYDLYHDDDNSTLVLKFS